MNAIKSLREKTGMTQKAFGDALGGIPVRSIQNWESGVRTPPPYLLFLIEYYVEHSLNKKEG